MQTRQTLSLIALGIAVTAIIGVSAMAETDLTGVVDAALFGDHEATSQQGGPVAASVQAWPCIDAPGCDRPPLGVLALADSVAEAPSPAMVEASPVPLPAALTLLGMALALAALGLRSRRPA